ncbi:MAG: substrate-binding periplasmic protein [Pseudomonadales bacterium]
MKRLTNTVLITLCTLLLPQQAIGATKSPCQLRMGWDTWHPFSFKLDNRVTGLDINTVETLLEDIGCSVTYHQMPWKRQLNALKKGAVDVIPGAYFNSERALWANFSEPYRFERSTIFIMKNGPYSGVIKSLDDIVPLNFRVAMTRGGYLGERHKAQLKNTHYLGQIFYSPNDSHMREMLLRGRVDGYVKESVSERAALRKQGLAEKIVSIPQDVYRSGVHLMFNRTVDELVIKRFNQALAAFSNSAEHHSLKAHYIEGKID